MRFLRSIKLYEDERSFLVPMLSLLHLDTLQFPCDAQDCAMFNRFVIQTDFARVCLHYESYGEQPPLHYLGHLIQYKFGCKPIFLFRDHNSKTQNTVYKKHHF